MNNKFIFELTKDPIIFYIGHWNLSRFFYPKNSFWVNEGEPLEVSDRKYALDCLKNELPQGYSLDLANGSIDIIKPDGYLQDTINRLQNTNPQQPIDYPLGWWKKEVCLFGDILIYFDEELFTLHEFLLYMISRSKEDGIQKLYVGGVFEYYD